MARRARRSTNKVEDGLTDNDATPVVEDGELPAEDWDTLADETESSEPENLIEGILASIARTGTEEDDEEDDDVVVVPVATPAEDSDDEDDDDTFAEIRARGKDEFTCQSCWLIRFESLRSKRDPSFCRDCD